MPGLIVALSAVLVVLAGAGTWHLLFETWVTPGPRPLRLLAGSGLFLMSGHFFIFMAYRVGTARGTAPFYYSFTMWAMLSGLIVFGDVPNWLSLLGMLLILTSGLASVAMYQRWLKQ